MNDIHDRLKTHFCEENDAITAVTYLGQEGFLFDHGGQFLAVDPYLTDYVDKNCSQLVEWKRKYPAPIKPEQLDFVDYVLLTHTHYDHADPWTLKAVAAAAKHTVFVCPAPETATIASYGIAPDRIVAAKADTPIELGAFTVTPVPSAHETFHRDENGDYRELGYIIEDAAGRYFHAGDMCMYDGLAARLASIDMAFLPVNGRDYFRNVSDIIGNFNADEAVLLAKTTGMQMLVPMHHDLYDVNGLAPQAFVEAVGRLDPMRRYHLFAVGERYIFSKAAKL